MSRDKAQQREVYSHRRATANLLLVGHDPANAEQRRRAASKGGKSKPSRVSKDLHLLLESLTEQVVAGDLEPYPASVAGQLVGVRLRLLEYERRWRETDELVVRLEELEEQITAEKNAESRRPWRA